MTTAQSEPEPSPPVLPEIPNWLCLGLLAGFILVILGNALFVNPDEVLSDAGMDLAHYFVHWRYFGFHELKSGNLALWNPHYYSGTPFLGNFQSALLYPLNFLYLLAPLEAAINWTIALHVFLGGVFTFYWVRSRGLHSLACLLSAMMFMFCGPHFLQIQAGHLPNLCTLIWAPLLFLSIDRLMDQPALGPCLLGMFTMAMSIFAGHPQYVFYMGVAAGIYSVLNLRRARQRGKIMLGLAGIVIGGIALSAVQLFTGLDEARESMRSIGRSYDFASSYSFPPENFLTLLAPRCFGNGNRVAYWGRWYVTEVTLFVSVMGLVLAVYGMVRGERTVRRFSIIMLVITLVLAMGGYTPLFHLLYNYVPGFNLFRGMDKFLWLAALFLSMLAGVGLDQMLRGRKVPWGLIAGVAGVGVALFGLAIVVPHRLDWWTAALKKIEISNAETLPNEFYTVPAFVADTSARFVRSLIWGAVCLFLAAALFLLARSHRRMACGGMLLMAVIELASFAEISLMTFRNEPVDPPPIVHFLAQNPGDYRITCDNPNNAMTTGYLNLDGDDPAALLRYIRYLYFTLGIDYDTDPYNTKPRKTHTSEWRMLRGRYVIMEQKRSYLTMNDPLPRLLLVDRFRVMTNFHEIFSTLTNDSFQVDKEIILESQPEPAPQPAGEMGTVKLLESGTDFATIEADTKTPCLLLITDSYSRGWRALALPGSSQARYQILPANYCLRTIPLAAGHHLFRMEYSPLGFRIGKVVSMAAWVVFIVLTVLAAAQNSQCKRMLKMDTGPRSLL